MMYLIFLMLLIKSLIFFFWAIMLSSVLLYSFTAYHIYFFRVFSSFFIINIRPSSSSLLMIFNAHFTYCTSVKTVLSFRVSILFWYFSSNVCDLCLQSCLSVFRVVSLSSELSLCLQSCLSVFIVKSWAICYCNISNLMFCVYINNYH